MKARIKTVVIAIIILSLSYTCSKDDKGTDCGEITYLGEDNHCPDGYIITVDDGTTIMSRCVKQSALNGLELGEYYCLYD